MPDSDIFESLGITKEELEKLAAHYGLARLAVFGSFSRGEYTRDSDVDFLVEWEKPANLGRYMGFIEDAENLTGRKVDLATPESLHWYIKDKILAEARDLI